MTDKHSLPTPITAAVNLPAKVGPPGQLLIDLAMEVATDMRETADILKSFSLTQKDYAAISKNPYFQRVLATAKREWESVNSTEDRLKLKARLALELGMITLGSRMADDKEPLNAAVEAGKLFAKLAGVGEERPTGAPGEKFTININLGADSKLSYEKNVTPKKSATSPSPLQLANQRDAPPTE